MFCYQTQRYATTPSFWYKAVGNIRLNGNKNPTQLCNTIYNFHHKSQFFPSFYCGINVSEMYQNLLLILQLGKWLTCVGFLSSQEERSHECEGVLGKVQGTCCVSPAMWLAVWFLIPLKVLLCFRSATKPPCCLAKLCVPCCKVTKTLLSKKCGGSSWETLYVTVLVRFKIHVVVFMTLRENWKSVISAETLMAR